MKTKHLLFVLNLRLELGIRLAVWLKLGLRLGLGLNRLETVQVRHPRSASR